VQEYLNHHKYHMQTFDEYQAAVKAAGFAEVKVQDITPQVWAHCAVLCCGILAAVFLLWYPCCCILVALAA
jgi:hypothetical protein